MNATAEFDKAGRIIVPKKVRDACHFRPGDRVDIEVQGGKAVLSHKEQRRGMFKERGLWVFDSGVPMSNADATDEVGAARERRIRFLSGESIEP